MNDYVVIGFLLLWVTEGFWVAVLYIAALFIAAFVSIYVGNWRRTRRRARIRRQF